MSYWDDFDQHVEDFTQRGISAQFLANLDATLASLGGQHPYVSSARGVGEQVAGFLGRAVPEVAAGVAAEALTGGLGLPALAGPAIGGAAAGFLGGLREEAPVAGALTGAAFGAGTAGILGALGRRAVPAAAEALAPEVAPAVAPVLAPVEAAAAPTIAPTLESTLSALFRRAAQGDAGAFREAAIQLGATPEEAAVMLSRNVRGANGRILKKAAKGANYAIELERLQKAPVGVPIAPGPSVPTTPSEAAQLVSTLKERFLQVGKPGAPAGVSDIEAARMLGRENLRRAALAAIEQDQGKEAAAAAAKTLPRVFEEIDDQTAAFIEETLQDLNPRSVARFASHLSGLRCFR